MLLTIKSARAPCSPIFLRLPVRVAIMSSISLRTESSGGDGGSSRASFSSFRSSTDKLAKLLTKFSGFLISWAIPATSWPSKGQLLGLHQAVLRRLQVLQCLLRPFLRRSRIMFVLFEFADVGINRDGPAVGVLRSVTRSSGYPCGGGRARLTACGALRGGIEPCLWGALADIVKPDSIAARTISQKVRLE